MKAEPTPTPPAPGWKSSEFWMTVLAIAIPAILASGLLPEGSPWTKVCAIVASVVAALGYSAGRVYLKGKAADRASKQDMFPGGISGGKAAIMLLAGLALASGCASPIDGARRLPLTECQVRKGVAMATQAEGLQRVQIGTEYRWIAPSTLAEAGIESSPAKLATMPATAILDRAVRLRALAEIGVGVKTAAQLVQAFNPRGLAWGITGDVTWTSILAGLAGYGITEATSGSSSSDSHNTKTTTTDRHDVTSTDNHTTTTSTTVTTGDNSPVVINYGGSNGTGQNGGTVVPSG